MIHVACECGYENWYHEGAVRVFEPCQQCSGTYPRGMWKELNPTIDQIGFIPTATKPVRLLRASITEVRAGLGQLAYFEVANHFQPRTRGYEEWKVLIHIMPVAPLIRFVQIGMRRPFEEPMEKANVDQIPRGLTDLALSLAHENRVGWCDVQWSSWVKESLKGMTR